MTAGVIGFLACLDPQPGSPRAASPLAWIMVLLSRSPALHAAAGTGGSGGGDGRPGRDVTPAGRSPGTADG